MLLLLRHCTITRIFRHMSTQPSLGNRFAFSQGDRMRKAMDVAGISVNELAAEFGVNRNTVSRWLNDLNEPSVKTLKVFAMRTGAPLAWLITGDLNENPPPSDDGGGNVSSLLSESNRRPSHYE